MARPHMTTPLSAAFTLVRWIEAHGREPHPLECRPRNDGLMSYMTYYRTLPGSCFSAMISMARVLVQEHEAVYGRCVLDPQPVKMRRCLGHTPRGEDCSTIFADEGPHVRLCARCRKARDVAEEMPAVSYVQLKRLGLGALPWEDVVDWGMD